LTANSTKKTINVILAMPHGVAAMSTDIETLVETSNNFANIKIENQKLEILTSQRSSFISRLHCITDKICAVTKVAGGESVNEGGYPPWPVNMDSPLLAKCTNLYEKKFGKKPVVEAIHAGLECGIIGDKYEGMDMISFGPTMKNVHSPDEKLFVPSIEKVWDFTVELLGSFK
jgi:dipeptidase D